MGSDYSLNNRAISGIYRKMSKNITRGIPETRSRRELAGDNAISVMSHPVSW
jgi:hypothetical protein